MTITFNPSSVGFGTLPVGATLPVSITVTSTETLPVSLAAPGSGFSMSPSPATVPANGTLVITVTFEPTSNTSYTGAVSTTVVSPAVTLQLSGWGTSIDTTDKFESEQGAAGDPTAAGEKHYQILVPNFTSVGVPTGVAIPTVPSSFVGTSFLRIGSSPTDWSTTGTFGRSANLARLVADPAQVLAAEGITVSNGSITSNNYDGPNASTLPPATYTAPTYSFGNFQDGSGLPGTPYGTKQDPNFLLGFGDDTRFRGDGIQRNGVTFDRNPKITLVGNAPADNTPQNRQTETLQLLTKGGWWDHSDGNRVTTTAGDKVEVIQGNYKLVVLGRQTAPAVPTRRVDLSRAFAASSTLEAALEAWYAETNSTQKATKSAAVDTAWGAVPESVRSTITSNANVATGAGEIRVQFAYKKDALTAINNTFITDVSGGHFQEQYPSPTPCIKTIEFVQDEGGEWTLYQDNGIGNLITKLKGRTVDLFQGASRETYVGSKDTPINTSLDPVLISKTWAQKIYSQTGSATKPVGEGTTATAFPDSMPADHTALTTGDVFSVTWAQRLLSYTGSTAKPVPFVYSETQAGNVKSVTKAKQVESYTTATESGVTSETTADKGNVRNITAATKGTVVSRTTGLAVTNVVQADGAVANVTTALGMVVNFTAGIGLVNASVGADIFNLNLGVSNICNLNVGLSMAAIDLTPYSVHLGVQSAELAGTKTITAARVGLGEPPAPATIEASAKAVAAFGIIGAVPAVLLAATRSTNT